MHEFKVKLAFGLYKRIKEESARRGCSMSALVRDAVMAYLEDTVV